MKPLFGVEELFLQIMNMSINGGIVILIVLLLRMLMRKAPKWICCLLWALAAFRLLCPFAIQSEYSLMGNQRVLPDDFIYAAVPKIDSGVEAVDEAVNGILEGSLATEPYNSVNRTQVLAFVCARLWLLGVSGMLLYALITSLLLGRRMARATLLRENIKQSEWAASPFVMGIFRPVIYLPYAMDEADREAVILHERAHILRRDHLSKVLAFAVLAVHWFNPLVWIAYVLFCRDMEKACDEKVISEMDEAQRRGYASALLNCAAGKRVISFHPLAFGEEGVKGRIIGVMKYKKPVLPVLVFALIAVCVVCVCFLTDPPQQLPMYRPDDPDAAEVTYLPTPQNAADDAAGDGEMLVIYCPANPKEGEGSIQIGGAVCNEVSEYLRTRKWSRLNGEVKKSSPGSIDFVISDSRRVVIYNSRVASIQYGEEVQWYRTGWGDYNAALALVHASPHAAQNDSEGNWLNCTVVSDERVTYLELGEYEGDLGEESMTRVQASEKGSILFYPDWECKQLVVSEHYYTRIGHDTRIEKKTFYLSQRDESGAYVLDFSYRGGEQDRIIYYVQGENGKYIFGITFGEGAAKFSAEAVFRYGDSDIKAELSAADLRTVMKILSDKPMYTDHPSCGFTEDVSVRMDGRTFCIANDTCPVVYVKEEGRYIRLTDGENEMLRKLLGEYGFVFPCL